MSRACSVEPRLLSVERCLFDLLSVRLLQPDVPRRLETPAGLRNVGNTCYINCIVQTYFHLPSLRSEVLALPPPPAEWCERHADAWREEGPSTRRFAFELQRLFGRLQLSARPAIDPRALLQELFANSRFKFGDEADASECNKLLLERCARKCVQLSISFP